MLNILPKRVNYEVKAMGYPPDSPPARIIAAGRKLFLEMGFERVSTDMIAKEAKVSKASLYKYFPNMSEVLSAVVISEGEVFEAGFPSKCETLDELKAALIQYGGGLLKFLNDPETIQFTQLMHEEVRAHPKLASKFYDAAYGRCHGNISTMIEYGREKGYIVGELTSEEMAEQLVGMWESLRWVRAVIGLSKRPYASPKDWATKCVETLLDAVAADGAKA